MGRATIVFSGGGVWGVAWMTGLVKGFADLGLDIRIAGASIGTSAGSIVAAQLGGPAATDDLFERQTVTARQPRERPANAANLAATAELLRRPFHDESERLRAICDLAETASTISSEARRQDIIERLGANGEGWPERPLRVTAIDMETLQLQTFDATSSVSLLDAVTASCAVPGVWPPAVIAGRRYIDGGVSRTAENAHLAAGATGVLILSPLGGMAGSGLGVTSELAADVRRLEDDGARVALIAADEASLRTMASNPLDPATRAPAAEAGRRQAANALNVARGVLEV